MFKNISLKSLDINTEMRESLRLAHLGTFEGLDIDILKVNELSNQHSPCYVKGMFDSFNIKPGAWYLPLALSLSEPTLKKDIESLKPVLETAVSLEAVRSILLLPAGSD